MDVMIYLLFLGDDSIKYILSVLIVLDFNRLIYFFFFNYFICFYFFKRYGRFYIKRWRCIFGSLVKIFNGGILWSNLVMNRFCYIFWFNIESVLLEKIEVYV